MAWEHENCSETFLREAKPKLQQQLNNLQSSVSKGRGSDEISIGIDMLKLRLRELSPKRKKTKATPEVDLKNAPNLARLLLQITKPDRRYTIGDYETLLKHKHSIEPPQELISDTLHALLERGRLKKRILREVDNRELEWRRAV